MDVEYISATFGDNVWQFNYSGDYAQQFQVVAAESGISASSEYHQLVPRCNTSLRVDVSNASNSDGDWEKQVGKEKMDEFFNTYTDEEECNIVSFVRFFGITREQYIEVMGMTDVLDEKLTRHHPDCPYTNREFVDAIFGDDPALSERIFAIDVFETKG